MAEKKGFIYKMVMGKDRDEDYARSTLPSNRWGLFWDIFKGRLGKLALVNLLTVLFLLPVIVLMYFRNTSITVAGASLPFLGTIGVGYPSSLDVELQYIQTVNGINFWYFLMMIPAMMIAGIGLAGAFYVIRNMVWTEGIFVANDFWRGIKKNGIQFVTIMLILGAVLFLAVFNFNVLSITEYTSGVTFWTVAARVSTWIVLILIGMMALYMMTMTVTYKLKFRHLIKNSFILSIAMLLQNVLFIVLGLVPLLVGLLLYLLLPSMLITVLILIVYILIGISIFILAWTTFNQWAYDKFINDRVEGAVKNRGIYPKVKDSDVVEKRKKAAVAQFRNPKKRRAVKPVNDKDVKLTNLEQGFTRASLEKLTKEKEQLKLDAEKYAAQHPYGDEDEDEDTDVSEAVDGDDEDFKGYEEAMKLEGYDPDTQNDLLIEETPQSAERESEPVRDHTEQDDKVNRSGGKKNGGKK